MNKSSGSIQPVASAIVLLLLVGYQVVANMRGDSGIEELLKFLAFDLLAFGGAFLVSLFLGSRTSNKIKSNLTQLAVIIAGCIWVFADELSYSESHIIVFFIGASGVVLGLYAGKRKNS